MEEEEKGWGKGNKRERHGRTNVCTSVECNLEELTIGCCYGYWRENDFSAAAMLRMRALVRYRTLSAKFIALALPFLLSPPRLPAVSTYLLYEPGFLGAGGTGAGHDVLFAAQGGAGMSALSSYGLAAHTRDAASLSPHVGHWSSSDVR